MIRKEDVLTVRDLEFDGHNLEGSDKLKWSVDHKFYPIHIKVVQVSVLRETLKELLTYFTYPNDKWNKAIIEETFKIILEDKE